MSKDQAARIAEYAFCESSQPNLYRTIQWKVKRAITTAVRKERERCRDAVGVEAVAAMIEKRFVNPGNIIRAINGGKR